MTGSEEHRPSCGDLVGADVIDRCQTELGELVLRRRGAHYELISDGMFIMDTRDGRSEQVLIDEALAVALPRARVVIGGLGFGFSLEAAVASATPASIVVVEIHPKVIEWNWAHLPERTGRTMADPRVQVLCADVGEWLDRDDGPLDVVCFARRPGLNWP
jgi:spermidine synthase